MLIQSHFLFVLLSRFIHTNTVLAKSEPPRYIEKPLRAGAASASKGRTSDSHSTTAMTLNAVFMIRRPSDMSNMGLYRTIEYSLHCNQVEDWRCATILCNHQP